MKCSNKPKAREYIQDGHQMAMTCAANALLKITQPILPNICRSQAIQCAALIVAHGVKCKKGTEIPHRVH